MGVELFNMFPYSQMDQANLDWVFTTVNKVVHQWDEVHQEWISYQNDMNDKFDALKNTQDSQQAIINSTWQETLNHVIYDAAPNWVTFGVDENGYFNAYIPQNWNMIQFFTVMDPNSPVYGKLGLTYQWAI